MIYRRIGVSRRLLAMLQCRLRRSGHQLDVVGRSRLIWMDLDRNLRVGLRNRGN
jgi:hypothetical protein